MKKRPRGIIFLWILIAAAAAGATFLIRERLGARTQFGQSGSAMPSALSTVAPDADINTDDGQDISASGTAAAAVPMQAFSGDGYSFSVPASWSIESTTPETVALHPSPGSPDAACKIEISAFPYSSDVDAADWIAGRIGADPSIAVVEQSSENVALDGDGAAGVKWIGTIDGIPTTLVYAFSAGHAYEIAPSVIGESADGSAQCNAMLEIFLSGLKI
jgi:hypothetical protein